MVHFVSCKTLHDVNLLKGETHWNLAGLGARQVTELGMLVLCCVDLNYDKSMHSVCAAA